MNKGEVKAHGRHVLVEVTKLPEVIEDVHVGEQARMTKTQTEFYYGEALEVGPNAADDDQCPELVKGDKVIFQQLGGFMVPTTDGYCKIMDGYNIVAKTTSLEEMNKKTITPTGDRILIEVIGEGLVSEDADGNEFYDESKGDPRDQDTQKGIVVSCGPQAEVIAEGTIVFFDPYCGNLIVNEADLMLKTVNSFDILFSTKNTSL